MKHRTKANGEKCNGRNHQWPIGRHSVATRRGLSRYKAESFREAPTTPSSHFDRHSQCSSLACAHTAATQPVNYCRTSKLLTADDRYWQARLERQRTRSEPEQHIKASAMAAGLKTIIALSFVCRVDPSQSCLLTVDAGPCYRLPPCHPLRCSLPQLPYAPRRCDICASAFTELGMFEMRQPR